MSHDDQAKWVFENFTSATKHHLTVKVVLRQGKAYNSIMSISQSLKYYYV